MEKIDAKIDRFLPYGESLRAVLQHESIKDRERKFLLRMKGVFLNGADEDSAFPLLLTSLLSPNEFSYLKESLRAKEDREKTVTRTLDWESTKPLIAAIPKNFNIQEIAKTNFPRYRIVGNPNFKMVEGNPDKIALDFKCETTNYSKAWFRGTDEFSGQVTFEKILSKQGKVQLQIVHTSRETIEIAEKVTKSLETHFKENGYMNTNKSVERILFRDFTNEQRIRFFLRMTKGNGVFTFKRATFLDIGPDQDKNLPREIDWLELAKVRELNINGEVLHKIPFLGDRRLHQFMELAEMEIIYDFSLPWVEGECKVQFGFHNYFSRRIGTTELVVDIIRISPKEQYNNLSTTMIRSKLLREFETYKTETYEWSRQHGKQQHAAIN